MRDLITEIWESVRRNKLRTALTGFSVAWGIFMLIVLLGSGNGLMNSFNQDSDSFASNSMMLFSGNTTKPYGGYQQGRWVPLKVKDMELIKKSFPDNIEEVTSSVSQSGFTINYGKNYLTSATLQGTFPEDAKLNKVEMVAGRFINRNDIVQERKVLVAPHLIARNFLAGGTDYESLIGKKVKVGDFMFTVIGVRRSQENSDDREVYVPYSTIKKIFAVGENVNNITFTFNGLDTEAENDEFEKEIRAVLNTAHYAAPDDPGPVHIWNRFKQHLQMNQAGGLLQTALWVIGIFTLLSGIVGVGNIMLITVKERTHEFGIRKAIGAKPWQVMKLIISESVAITLTFGYLGMILGLVACEILDATLGQQTMAVFGEEMKMLVNPGVGVGTAIGATVILVVAGTFAGIIPARKASRVKPIEALMAS